MNWMLKNLILMMLVCVCVCLSAPTASAEDVSIGPITISGTKCPSLPTANASKYLTFTVVNNTGEEKKDLWMSVEIKTDASNGQWVCLASSSIGVLAPGGEQAMCSPFDTPTPEVRVQVRDGGGTSRFPVVASKTKALSIDAKREAIKKNIPAMSPKIKNPVVKN